MANLVLFLLTILLIIPNLRPFSAAQPPASAPTVAGPTDSPISIPSPSPATILPPQSSPSIITITPLPPPSSPSPIINISPPPPPPPPLYPPPTTTINSPTPPPQPIQLNNIIDALIGAGDFAGWANILSNTNPSNLPLSATFFIPVNDALSHLPTSTASGAINFDPLIIAYHIIPQRLSFPELLLFKSLTRLPTLLPTKSILITNNSPTNFSVDNSPITHPDMYTNSDVSVHGIGTILNYTAYGGNPFQPPVQQIQNPPSEVAGNRRSDSPIMFIDYQLLFSIICAVLAFNIEMGRFNKTKITLILCGLCFFATAHGVSVDSLAGSCLIAYRTGAPAVLQSPKCTHWVQKVNSFKEHTGKCDLAPLQGHQEYQEHRMTCILDLKIPVLGIDGYKEAKVDLLAIFDGHEWIEASEMANKKLLDYFLIHVLFSAINEEDITVDQHYLNPASPPNPRVVLSVETGDESYHYYLKEALLHAIHDIELELWWEAYRNHYSGGSRATVVLVLNDEEILVARLGHAPALLCKGSSTRKLIVERLTKAIGDIAIGDIVLKSFGVISEPEVKGKLTRIDRYLVIASRGIFESLTRDDVCKIIEKGGTSKSIVKAAALKKGSMDNLSAIVLPLRPPTRSNSPSQPSKDEEL